MSTYDLGDVVPLGVTVLNAAGNPANATTVTCTIYLPDGTTTQGSVANTGTGLYNVDYTPTQVGRYQVKWTATGENASAYADEFTVRDFARMGVVSLSDTKQHLNITSTKHDEELRYYIDAATDLCERYAGIVLGRRVVTETYDGGVTNLRLRTPIAYNVTTVVENGVTLAAGTYTLDASGMFLWRIGSSVLMNTSGYGAWAPGAQNITVTYTAGFVSPPPVARQGTLEAIRHLWETQRGAMAMGRGAADSEFMPGMTYSLPRRVIELLDQIKVPGVA